MKKKTVLAASIAAVITANISTAEELVLEEVIVNAQKTQQSLLDTPVAVNAVSGDQFAEMASFNLTDVDRFTAGVDLSGREFETNITLRGVGTKLDAAVSPRVSTYLDGTFISRQNALFLSQYDLKQIEILRGPQGTLYGKSSPAGAITIRTADPDLSKNSGYIQTAITRGKGINTQFGASAPIIEDELAVRVSGVYDHNENTGIENSLNNDKQTRQTSGGRLTVLWQPNDKFDARLSASYQDHTAEPDKAVIGTGGLGTIEAKDRRAISNDDHRFEVTERRAIVEANYAVTDNLFLSSVTSHIGTFTSRRSDGDNTHLSVQTQQVDSALADVWNQEFRVSSTGNETWNWIAGVYYANSSAQTDVIATANVPGGALPPPAPPFPASIVIGQDIFNSNEDWGVFTHNTIVLNDEYTLTGGLRYTKERRGASQIQERDTTFFGLGGPIPTPTSVSQLVSPSGKSRTEESVTGTLKLQREISEDETYYWSYDRGFRGGNTTVDARGGVPASLLQFENETSDNFEIGYKRKFWDGRGQLSSALYKQFYDDFQVQRDGIFNPAAGGIGDLVHNADKVVIQGAEVEANAIINEHWSGLVSLSYVDARFDSYDDAPCNDGTLVAAGTHATCDLSGERATDVPQASAVVMAEYTQPTKTDGVEFFFRALYNYQSGRKDQESGIKTGGFGTTDLFLGWRTLNRQWELTLWSRNAFDKVAILDTGATVAGYTEATITAPRLTGLTGTYRWGIEDE